MKKKSIVYPTEPCNIIYLSQALKRRIQKERD